MQEAIIFSKLDAPELRSCGDAKKIYAKLQSLTESDFENLVNAMTE